MGNRGLRPACLSFSQLRGWAVGHKMPRTCTICKHPGREPIERALLAGEPYRHISVRENFGSIRPVLHSFPSFAPLRHTCHRRAAFPGRIMYLVGLQTANWTLSFSAQAYINKEA